MNRNQQALVTLVSELVGTCAELGLDCRISERLAWESFLCKGNEEGFFGASIMLPKPDFDTLLDRLQQQAPENRLVESIYQQDGECLLFHYSDANTTLLNMKEAAVESFHLHVSVTAVLTGEDSIQAMLSNGKLAELSSNPFSESCIGIYGNRCFPIPSDPRSYLRDVLGGSWRDKCLLSGYEESIDCLANPAVPFDSFSALIENDHESLAALLQDKARYREWRAETLNPAKEDSKQLTKLFRQLTQRFRLCELYLPHKQYLIDQWNAGNKDEVADALAEYTQQLAVFYKLGMTLHFDDELFDLVIAALESRGVEYASELRALVPQEHLERPIAPMIAPYILES